jgi:hypothetical protein
MAFDKDSKEMKALAHMRRVRNQAYAILQRAESAGIPEKYMRINGDSFKDLLCNSYHSGSVDSTTDFIFKEADEFCKIPVVLIDGGDIESRKKAGFALLFRVLACDKSGVYKDCADLVHKFDSKSFDFNKSEYIQGLKDCEVLFISEFRTSLFGTYSQSGDYIDEVLGYRSDHGKITIISYSKSINGNNLIEDVDQCGQYFALYSKKEFANQKDHSSQYTEEIMRIKVK